MGEPASEQSVFTRNSFVGRERELVELVSACASGADGDTHLFLIHGEPGIGKTRPCDELASRAKARGMQVLWGRCWEGGGAPAYWPWIQVIRSYLGALDFERRRLVLESEIAADGQSAIGPIFGTTPQTSGNLYGTTETGGANLAGTVFELTPNGTGGWNESIPHSFDGPAASQETFAGVIADASGNLYGTTELGGTSGSGTVFELTAAGAYSVLHSFSGPDGAGPFAGVLMDSSGNLYGTTVGGGAHTRGTVFKLTPPSVSGGSWTESVLWSFGGSVI